MSDLNELYQHHLKTRLEELDTLLDAVKMDGVLIHSGIPKTQFADDNGYPFAVNPYFKALVPITDNPHSFIFYTPGKRPQLIYFQPEDYWHAAPAEPAGVWVNSFDIHTINSPEKARAHLPDNLEKIAYLGEDADQLGWSLALVNPQELVAPLHYQRGIKTAYELACLREATKIAVKGHLAAEQAFIEGCSELEIHLRYLAACAAKESEMPYNNIVALNESGAVLHYDRYRRQRIASHSFLIDAGADYKGYAADITRTYSRDPGEFAELIKVMDAAQQLVIAKIKPGLSYVDLHVEFHRHLAEILSQFEIIKASPEMIFDKGWTLPFMPHGLGHLIGAQVHDVGGWQKNQAGDMFTRHERYPALRLQRELLEGMVVTIEPGLYFIEMLLREYRDTDKGKLFNWKKIDTLKPFGGIRIEDDVVVRRVGVENMTRDVFEQQQS